MGADAKWYIYILECKDKKLYTGITSNLEERIAQHNRGAGCRFTKFRGPFTLLYAEELKTRESALKREAQIKGFTRQKKLALISRYTCV